MRSRGLRRAYYDKLSAFYDRFVALHSRNPLGQARNLLADQIALQDGGAVLDVRTGTGAPLPRLQEKVGRDGVVVGMDFLGGMLNAARRYCYHAVVAMRALEKGRWKYASNPETGMPGHDPSGWENAPLMRSNPR